MNPPLAPTPESPPQAPATSARCHTEDFRPTPPARLLRARCRADSLLYNVANRCLGWIFAAGGRLRPPGMRPGQSSPLALVVLWGLLMLPTPASGLTALSGAAHAQDLVAPAGENKAKTINPEEVTPKGRAAEEGAAEAPADPTTAPPADSPGEQDSADTAAAVVVGEPDAGPSIYFYNPDGPPTDLNRLTRTLRTAFQKKDLKVHFQAFARYEDFRKVFIERPPAFVVAPEWFTDDEELGTGLRLIARPLRNGKTTYRRALMARTEIAELSELRHGAIATPEATLTPNGERGVLDTFNLDPTQARVVRVAEDTDALMAVTFGDADAALVTASRYRALADSNPKVARGLHVIGFSPAIPFPALFAAGTTGEKQQREVGAILADLTSFRMGRKLLETLQYDGFKPAGTAQASARAAKEPAELLDGLPEDGMLAPHPVGTAGLAKESARTGTPSTDWPQGVQP